MLQLHSMSDLGEWAQMRKLENWQKICHSATAFHDAACGVTKERLLRFSSTSMITRPTTSSIHLTSVKFIKQRSAKVFLPAAAKLQRRYSNCLFLLDLNLPIQRVYGGHFCPTGRFCPFGPTSPLAQPPHRPTAPSADRPIRPTGQFGRPAHSADRPIWPNSPIANQPIGRPTPSRSTGPLADRPIRPYQPVWTNRPIWITTNQAAGPFTMPGPVSQFGLTGRRQPLPEHQFQNIYEPNQICF